MKSAATILLALILSSVVQAKEVFEGPPAKSWDSVRVIELAKELYRRAWQTSAAAQAEFPGGAPGLADLAAISQRSQTYLLTVKKYKDSFVKSEKWFRPIAWGIFMAENTMPSCSPGYSNTVENGFVAIQDLHKELTDYYPPKVKD